ncbi:hypothetical protein [Legionella israelensis]|uniref:hypothetical protein n=1 Tax=Legionella israelensis TaxID=454 RepID=UPI00142FDF31|nr:hypothetical protein [Legionella israelensis]
MRQNHPQSRSQTLIRQISVIVATGAVYAGAAAVIARNRSRATTGINHVDAITGTFA